MPCYYPLPAKYSTCPVSGLITVNVMQRDKEGDFKVSCGQCLGCRLKKSKEWAMRIMHEAQMQEESGNKNCFITLTYSDENLPYSLDHTHVQKFLKKLRNETDKQIRYYMCGEYAPITDKYGRTLSHTINNTEVDILGRAHYHILIFGIDFDDKVYWTTKEKNRLYRSPMLEKLWTFGNSIIGNISIASAEYVAGYLLKKILGGTKKENDKHYNGRKPEYTAMSRGGNKKKGNKGGIGKTWFEKYCNDIFPNDRVIIKGQECKPARYYDKLFDILETEEFEEIKKLRKEEAEKRIEDNTQYRLIDKEKIQKAKMRIKNNNLERDMKNE